MVTRHEESREGLGIKKTHQQQLEQNKNTKQIMTYIENIYKASHIPHLVSGRVEDQHDKKHRFVQFKP